jgi:hypothetical protein
MSMPAGWTSHGRQRRPADGFFSDKGKDYEFIGPTWSIPNGSDWALRRCARGRRFKEKLNAAIDKIRLTAP